MTWACVKRGDLASSSEPIDAPASGASRQLPARRLSRPHLARRPDPPAQASQPRPRASAPSRGNGGGTRRSDPDDDRPGRRARQPICFRGSPDAARPLAAAPCPSFDHRPSSSTLGRLVRVAAAVHYRPLEHTPSSPRAPSSSSRRHTQRARRTRPGPSLSRPWPVVSGVHTRRQYSQVARPYSTPRARLGASSAWQARRHPAQAYREPTDA